MCSRRKANRLRRYCQTAHERKGFHGNMPNSPHRDPDLADVATLAAALDWDAQRTVAQQADFDRRTATRIPNRSTQRVEAVIAWLESACGEVVELRQRRERFRFNLQLANLCLTGLGIILGIVTTLGAFYYDGAGRVNIVAVIAAIVALPALLLLPFLWATLPNSAVKWIPGGHAAGIFFRGLNLGRLGWVILRRLPPKWREAWETTLHRADRHQVLYANLQKWTTLRGSQLFALGFQCAALLTASGLIVFSDLVFGWSTTLSSGDPLIDAERLQILTNRIAWPWAWSFDSAVPSIELIRESRFFRAAAGTLSNETAARLGQWWPFVLLSMFIYGLLPRLFTFALAHSRASAAAKSALSIAPGFTAIQNRLHRAWVQTTAEQTMTENPTTPISIPENGFPEIPLAPTIAINWAGVPIVDEQLKSLLFHATIFHAGGASSLESDEAILSSIMTDSNDGPVALIVKAWEPPLLEFIDFVRDLRTTIGPVREILVQPVELDPAGLLISPKAEALAVWKRQLARAGDPWLRTVPLYRSEVSR